MYILGIMILSFFAVIGLACFIGALVKAGSVSDTEGFIMLIPSVTEDNAEARIRSASALISSARGCRIVCVCPNDSPAKEICGRLKKQLPQLEISNRFSL